MLGVSSRAVGSVYCSSVGRQTESGSRSKAAVTTMVILVASAAVIG